MKKSDYRAWLTDRMALQNRLLLGALLLLSGMSTFALLVEGLLLLFVLRFWTCGIPFVPTLLTLATLAASVFATWLRLPKTLPDSEHESEIQDRMMTFTAVPPMGTVWTYALGKIDTDRGLLDRIIGMLALPQRLTCAVWYVYHRWQQSLNLQIEPCAAVLRMLLREGQGMEISAIAEKCDVADLQRTIRDVSLVDGVVFLSRRKVGISVTPRLTEDVAEWEKKHRATSTDD